MAIPDYQTLMLPLLRQVSDGQERRFRDALESLAQELEISSDERAVRLPSGTAFLFDNRAAWARTYLKQAGLLESPKRGFVRITARGEAVLAQKPRSIDNSVLAQFPEFLEFKQRRAEQHPSESPCTPQVSGAANASSDPSSLTPEEMFAQAYQRMRTNLEAELLEQVKAASPAFFERLVVDLLLAMGYGGSREDAGQAIGGSGDGGVDGIIKEDRLGLEAIYIQAKRWEATVGRPEIQKFAGALQGRRSTKGVFITTSSFSTEAEEYVSIIHSKIILIPGAQLVKLMVDHNVGVSSMGRFEIKRIDSDYFEGE